MAFGALEQQESTLMPDDSGAEIETDGADATGGELEGEAGGAEGGGSDATSGEAGGEPKTSRADKQKARIAAHKARQDAERETREENTRLRAAIERMEKTSARTADMIERTIPKPKDPQQEKLADLYQKRQTAAARMGNDPAAYKEWEKLGDDIVDLRADIRADQKIKEHGANQPKQPPADVQRLASEFGWLTSNVDAREATELEIKRLVNLHKRDMKNATIRYKTLREAAANVAASWGLDPGYEPDPAAAGRLSGPGGKTSAPGAGGDVEMSRDEDKMAMARALFPNDDEETQWKKWVASVGAPVLKAGQKKR